MKQDLPGACTLTVMRQPQSSYVVVSFVGEVDVSSVSQVRTSMREMFVEGDVHLLLDLSGVTFMDSAGLGLLVGIRRQARMFRGSLAVVAPSRPVRRIFELTALDKVFHLYATLEEARAQGVHGQLDAAHG